MTPCHFSSKSVASKDMGVLSLLSPLWAGVNTLARPLLSARSEGLPCPVISVGNILAGGVGKTEVTSFLARKFLSQGLKVAISMRGYGSPWERRGGYSSHFTDALSQGFPDEALVHLWKAPGVTVAVGSKRKQVLKKYWAEIKPDVVLLDDGYQHFALKRDIDIVVHDFSVTNPIYRDSLRALKRGVIPFSMSEVPSAFRSLNWVSGAYELLGMKGRERGLEPLPSHAFVFSGIGNPKRLEASLLKRGVSVGGLKQFPDHAIYDSSRIAELNQWVHALRAQHGDVSVLTTLKDYVKLMNKLSAFSFEVKYIDLNLKITENEEFFWSQINEVLAIRRS